jgi:hypothetical protein
VQEEARGCAAVVLAGALCPFLDTKDLLDTKTLLISKHHTSEQHDTSIGSKSNAASNAQSHRPVDRPSADLKLLPQI